MIQAVKNGKTILVGEDEQEVRSYLEVALKCQGYSVECAEDGDELLAVLRNSGTPISAILLDLVMPRRDGIETLREIRRFDQDVPVIVVSGASSPLNIVEAMKTGATDFLPKPITHEDLRNAIKKVVDKRGPGVPGPAPQPAVAHSSQFFFGSSPYMQELQSLLSQIGWSEAPVLLQGETGVGKEMLARELHARSPRADKPFLKLNCAALPSELVESELFGYDRGAFTGAFQKKPGMFELADGGTILLDEIGDMDFKLQAKLLQVLQDHEFRRLGGKETVRVDVRVLAATHRDLEKAIMDNNFREDLYYRLNVISLRVPPLRERKDDILPIAECLLGKHANAKNVPALAPALKHALLAYDWPGNIRELENVMRKYLILCDPGLIIRELQARAFRKATLRSSGPATPARQADPVASESAILEHVTQANQQAERAAILAALTSTRWNRKQAAALLKIDYKPLLYKMKKLGIHDRALAHRMESDEEPVATQGHALSRQAGAGL
jgi:two-component system response regulator AtoC